MPRVSYRVGYVCASRPTIKHRWPESSIHIFYIILDPAKHQTTTGNPINNMGCGMLIWAKSIFLTTTNKSHIFLLYNSETSIYLCESHKCEQTIYVKKAGDLTSLNSIMPKLWAEQVGSCFILCFYFLFNYFLNS